MATHCGHSNAPAEYALKEEQQELTPPLSDVYVSHTSRMLRATNDERLELYNTKIKRTVGDLSF